MKIIGLDEVGRGCWAGPLVACAVLFDDAQELPGLHKTWRLADSKVMTKKQRQLADGYIKHSALAYGIGWVSSQEVDKHGLTAAVRLAMQRAMAALSTMEGSGLPPFEVADRIIVDGSINFLKDLPRTEAIIKADGSIPAVSAASILAKVARDAWMASEADAKYPGYGFARHVGYGTLFHREALALLGVTELHRRSFRPIAALC
jgi:ribonuclease HII